ncbi:MAG TPA: flagellar basal body L-ring protein FlgH, partial [Marmoricola sp.]|nr:flagellar basal body L-ring protein FlgH [Marmoricola sp.]
TTTSSKTVASKSEKDGGVSLTPPPAGPLSLNPDKLKASNNSSFKGQGNASQTSSLSGSLSVTIAEVRPNGTALVRGEKRMLLSQGQEVVHGAGSLLRLQFNPDLTDIGVQSHACGCTFRQVARGQGHLPGRLTTILLVVTGSGD